MIRIKLVLFRHPAVDNIFMIFWEGIKLFSVFCVVSVTSGFNKHCSRFLSTFNSLVEHGMSCTFIVQLLDNIFMIFWEGIKLFSVFCVVSVTSGFNKHCSRFLSTFNYLVEHGMSCTFIVQLLDIILCLIYKLHFCVILSKVLVKNY